MLINSLAIPTGRLIHYDPAFRVVIEDHLNVLRNDVATIVMDVEPIAAYKYEFDLFSFLTSIAIPTDLHWVIMRMNRMTAPFDFDANVKALLIPSTSTLDRIVQSHQTVNRIN